MAAQGNLTLNSKVYNPRGKAGDVASWVLYGDTSFGGASSTVSESVRGPSKAGLTRVQWKLVLPKAATADSACGCAGTEIGQSIWNLDVTMPSIFTAAERADALQRFRDAVATTAPFGVSISALEPSW